MTMRLGKISAIAVVLCIGCAAIADAQAQSKGGRSESGFEAGTFFGAMIAGKEIARGVNATGGEQLIARLNHGGALGLRVGVHGELLGLEANFLSTSAARARSASRIN